MLPLESNPPLFGPGDGCTLWFDELAGVSWRHCCDVHDWAYYYKTPKIEADLELARCVAEAGAPAMALVMLVGVLVFGTLFYYSGKRNDG